MMTQGTLHPTGCVTFQILRPQGTSLGSILRAGLPIGTMPAEVRRWRFKNMPRFLTGYFSLVLAKSIMRLTGIPIIYSVLSLRKIQGDGQVLDYGVASLRKVTVAAVNYIATRLVDGNTSIGAFDFHGYGTGTNAESNADTTLQTEFTTQYATDNVRPTGTPTNPSANVYQSVATFAPDSGGTLAVTEHGIFSANAAGTLLDRSVFSVVNLVGGTDSMVTTYQMTLSAEI